MLVNLLNSVIAQLIKGVVSVMCVPFTERVPFIVTVGTVVSLICIVMFLPLAELFTFPNVSFTLILPLLLFPSNSLCPLGIKNVKLLHPLVLVPEGVILLPTKSCGGLMGCHAPTPRLAVTL